MVGPNHEAESTDNDDCPDHQAIAENMPSGMYTYKIGDDAKRGQGDNVDFGVPEKPKQVLKQYRAAAAILQLLPKLDNAGHEKAGPQQPVEGHHYGGD